MMCEYMGTAPVLETQHKPQEYIGSKPALSVAGKHSSI